MAFDSCSIHAFAWLKYTFGDADPLTRAVRISNVSKFATGRYRLTISSPPDSPGTTFVDDGICDPSISGPYAIAADFIDETTIEVQTRSLSTGALVDPANGSRVSLIVFLR